MTSPAAISSWRASPRWNIAAEAGTSTCTSVPPSTPTTYWTEAPLNARNSTVTGTLFAISGSLFRREAEPLRTERDHDGSSLGEPRICRSGKILPAGRAD